jgi:hypothetical protein
MRWRLSPSLGGVAIAAKTSQMPTDQEIAVWNAEHTLGNVIKGIAANWYKDQDVRYVIAMPHVPRRRITQVLHAAMPQGWPFEVRVLEMSEARTLRRA